MKTAGAARSKFCFVTDDVKLYLNIDITRALEMKKLIPFSCNCHVYNASLKAVDLNHVKCYISIYKVS